MKKQEELSVNERINCVILQRVRDICDDIVDDCNYCDMDSLDFAEPMVQLDTLMKVKRDLNREFLQENEK